MYIFDCTCAELYYLTFGESEWDEDASSSGYGRGRELQTSTKEQGNRFAVVYHLLSVSDNKRLRLKALLPDNSLMIQSVTGIWNCADWYEREAFDLFGICLKTTMIYVEF